LNYTGPVLNGTQNSVIKRGVGLYSYSPMPSFGNPNVCIAGHRGVYGAEFYKLDKMQDGDLIYLYYDGFEFIYKYDNTKVVTLDNWKSIFCGDESSVTLTTCAMDNNVDRIIVTGKLVSVRECEKEEEYYKEPSTRTYTG
ncbi:MAG: class E sortase, partial [Oscillospiraceae bacterium]